MTQWFDQQLAAGEQTSDHARALSVFLHLERWLRALEDAQAGAGRTVVENVRRH